ncbi:MAG: AzlC family ABC transporter permease [Thermomicrobiales bacterium]
MPELATSWRDDVRRGAVAMVPLLPGVAPFSMAIAVSARAAGFSPLETFLFSLTVFAGSAQIATVGLLASGSGPVAIVLTALGLNLRHILYGLSLSTWLPEQTRPPKPILAATVTDEGYGLATRAAAQGAGSDAFLWGTNGILYLTWVFSALIGIALGQLLPDPAAIGLDVIFPLSFLTLLLPLLRARWDFLVAAVAGVGALMLRGPLGSGPAIVVSVVIAALLGALLPAGRGRTR